MSADSLVIERKALAKPGLSSNIIKNLLASRRDMTLKAYSVRDQGIGILA